MSKFLIILACWVIAVAIVATNDSRPSAGSEAAFSEAEVRLHTEIALDCVAEYAYTHPGIGINHDALLAKGGACDPFYKPGGNR